jgi:hypothetical protein
MRRSGPIYVYHTGTCLQRLRKAWSYPGNLVFWRTFRYSNQDSPSYKPLTSLNQLTGSYHKLRRNKQIYLFIYMYIQAIYTSACFVELSLSFSQFACVYSSHKNVMLLTVRIPNIINFHKTPSSIFEVKCGQIGKWTDRHLSVLNLF